MGSILSSTDSNTTSTDSPIPTDSQKPSSDSKTQTTQESPIETKPINQSDQEAKPTDQNQEKTEGDEEEEGECGFCLFMKEGGCRDAFINWEDCIREADLKQDDVASKCFDATSSLTKCMQAHSDYYQPILKVGREAEAQALKQLDSEIESVAADQTEQKGGENTQGKGQIRQ
ncbi:uncharacterized protein LOC126653413 [Mercurialis annua]|uniref:uncharacterized protein LOC126653413 n=1 Tax=Mercurialis annua TaxID=3986 RepID=UPI00215FBE7A|nr:uncharacterized protein LOC126653413 [Mercurialis annua]